MLKLKKFKSSFPQQELRRAKPIHCIDDDNSDADLEEEDIGLFLNPSNMKVKVQPNDFLKLGNKEMKMVSEILASRVEVGSDSGTSTVYSFSCNSDMETEAWANLASTFAAKEDTFGLDNSLRLYEEGVSDGKEVVNPPAVVVAATSHSEVEVELLYSSAVGVIMQEYGAVQSQADSPLSSSSVSTISTSGEYDPFGKRSDFSLPDAIPVAPQLVRARNIQFDNMGKLDKERKSALHSIMECQSLQTGAFTEHSESTSSIECLVQWCGGGVN